MEDNNKNIELPSKVANNKRVYLLFSIGAVVVWSLVYWLFKISASSYLVGFVVILFFSFLLYELLKEPSVSLIATPNKLCYFHKFGRYEIDWCNIQRIDIPTVSDGWDKQELPYIGIKLKQPLDHYESIPLRLASRLLLEQRSLHYQATKEGCSTGMCQAEAFMDKIEWRDGYGNELNGVSGMYANRCEILNQIMGFHVYLPSNSFRQPLAEILRTLRLYKNQTYN